MFWNRTCCGTPGTGNINTCFASFFSIFSHSIPHSTSFTSSQRLRFSCFLLITLSFDVIPSLNGAHFNTHPREKKENEVHNHIVPPLRCRRSMGRAPDDGGVSRGPAGNGPLRRDPTSNGPLRRNRHRSGRTRHDNRHGNGVRRGKHYDHHGGDGSHHNRRGRRRSGGHTHRCSRRHRRPGLRSFRSHRRRRRRGEVRHAHEEPHGNAEHIRHAVCADGGRSRQRVHPKCGVRCRNCAHVRVCRRHDGCDLVVLPTTHRHALRQGHGLRDQPDSREEFRSVQRQGDRAKRHRCRSDHCTAPSVGASNADRRQRQCPTGVHHLGRPHRPTYRHHDRPRME